MNEWKEEANRQEEIANRAQDERDREVKRADDNFGALVGAVAKLEQAATTERRRILALIRNDGLAMTCQSIGQYRALLVKEAIHPVGTALSPEGQDDLNAYITGQFDAAEANDEPPDNDEVCKWGVKNGEMVCGHGTVITCPICKRPIRVEQGTDATKSDSISNGLVVEQGDGEQEADWAKDLPSGAMMHLRPEQSQPEEPEYCEECTVLVLDCICGEHWMYSRRQYLDALSATPQQPRSEDVLARVRNCWAKYEHAYTAGEAAVIAKEMNAILREGSQEQGDGEPRPEDARYMCSECDTFHNNSDGRCPKCEPERSEAVSDDTDTLTLAELPDCDNPQAPQGEGNGWHRCGKCYHCMVRQVAEANDAREAAERRAEEEVERSTRLRARRLQYRQERDALQERLEAVEKIALRFSKNLPGWMLKDIGPGSDPTFYGTCSHGGDLKVIAQTKEDLAILASEPDTQGGEA
jgi:hypothetical protein